MPVAALDCSASHRSRTIRPILAIPFAAVLAIVIAVAGYSILLATRQDPLPRVAGREVEHVDHVDRHLPALTPLPDIGVVEATLRRPEPGRGTLEVHLSGIESPGQGGVAVFDGRSGALLSWLPFAAAEPVAAELRWQTQVPAGEHWLCAAETQQEARSGYLARTRCRIEEGRASTAALDAARHDVAVTLHLGAASASSTLLQLRRRDDAAWRLDPSSALTPPASGPLRLKLPAGVYELRPYGSSAPPVAIAVPGPESVDADFAK